MLLLRLDFVSHMSDQCCIFQVSLQHTSLIITIRNSIGPNTKPWGTQPVALLSTKRQTWHAHCSLTLITYTSHFTWMTPAWKCNFFSLSLFVRNSIKVLLAGQEYTVHPPNSLFQDASYWQIERSLKRFFVHDVFLPKGCCLLFR